jgi:hypothetical protein
MPLHRGALRAPKVRWALRWLERTTWCDPHSNADRTGNLGKREEQEKIHRETYTFRNSPYKQYKKYHPLEKQKFAAITIRKRPHIPSSGWISFYVPAIGSFYVPR